MTAHTPKQRVPLELQSDDKLLLLKLKHKLEDEEQKSLSMAEVIRIALRELANAKGV